MLREQMKAIQQELGNQPVQKRVKKIIVI